MSWKVHTQPNGNDKSVAGNHIHSEPPKVHESRNFNDSGCDTEYHNTGSPKTAKKDENREEDSEERGHHVLVQLTAYHLVSLPVRISDII